MGISILSGMAPWKSVSAALLSKFLTVSTEFDKHSSKWNYYSTDHIIFFRTFSVKVIRPTNSRICDVFIGIALFLKCSYQKIVFTKVGLLNWYSPMKFFFRKIWIILTKKNDFKWKNLALWGGLITSTKNVRENFQSHFCDLWSIRFSLKSFYQIPFTWSKYYLR